MESGKEQEIEARFSKIESALSALQRSVEGLINERRGAAASAGTRERASDSGFYSPAPSASRPRATAGGDIGATVSEWFSSRAPEWWLSRLGIGFVVIAVLFLYSYAVDKGWITPPLRVLAGALVGGGLFWAATRTHDDARTPTGFGLRQVLHGGALGVWYLTAYAASVW